MRSRLSSFRQGQAARSGLASTSEKFKNFRVLWQDENMWPGVSKEDGSAEREERGAGDLLLGALVGSALLPFIQAIAGNAGADVYAKIRELLSRRVQSRVSSELEESGTVTLVDPERRVVLCLPSRLTPEQAMTIANVTVSSRDGWYLVSWDEQVRAWRVRLLPERPAYGLDVNHDAE
jgi:hypothetical protein